MTRPLRRRSRRVPAPLRTSSLSVHAIRGNAQSLPQEWSANRSWQLSEKRHRRLRPCAGIAPDISVPAGGQPVARSARKASAATVQTARSPLSRPRNPVPGHSPRKPPLDRSGPPSAKRSGNRPNQLVSIAVRASDSIRSANREPFSSTRSAAGTCQPAFPSTSEAGIPASGIGVIRTFPTGPLSSDRIPVRSYPGMPQAASLASL